MALDLIFFNKIVKWDDIKCSDNELENFLCNLKSLFANENLTTLFWSDTGALHKH